MRLTELPQYLNIDVRSCLEERFMNSEELYLRFLRKLLTAQEFKLLEQATAANNWQEAERLAHNLKGVCANLGLTVLQVDFSSLVVLLRCENIEAQQVRQLLEQARLDWYKTLAFIKKLED